MTVMEALTILLRRGWEPFTEGGQPKFRIPQGDANAPEAVEALSVLRANRPKVAALLAPGGPFDLAQRIVDAHNAHAGLSAAVAPLSSMSPNNRRAVLLFLQAALPDRTGRARIEVKQA